jgi:CheY-like chemotaxis protein/anti-sigma regulatory factor (Ser/Thr protein kinase)
VHGGTQYGGAAAVAVSADGNVILLVDDTPSKRYVLASWLRRAGYQIVEEATGAGALDTFRRGGIDLVVLDVNLPDMSGFDACEAIKTDAEHGTTPVIHVSAAAIHAVDRTHGLTRGADAYLVEPIDPDELLATVTSILRYYRARLQAERLADRLTQLAQVTVAMSGASSQNALLHAAGIGASLIFQAPSAIFVTGGDGSRTLATCGGAGLPAMVQATATELVEAPLGIGFTDQSPIRWPQQSWPQGDTVRVLSVRPRADRASICVIVPTGATMPGGPELTLFGQAVLSAVEATSLYDEQHDLALTLQRSLLPRHAPPVPELDIAVRYVPASERAEIGGDFYEVAHFNDRLVVAVGDVGGHSLHAATIMAEIRHAMRAYLADGHSPASVLNRLNHLMQTQLPGEIATVCLLSIDVGTGEAYLANAGHPPPLLRTAAGSHLIEARGPLLGVGRNTAVEIMLTLSPGDTLVLYTDGLVETRVDGIDPGIKRLMDAATLVEMDLESFASRLLYEVGPADPDDDIAMIAVRRRIGRVAPPAGTPVHRVDIDRLAAIRDAIRDAAERVGLPEATIDDFVLAGNEVAANVVRHGGGSGEMWVWADDGHLRCRMTDHGTGMLADAELGTAAPPNALTGRGLWMLQRLADEVDVRTSPTGTTVTIMLSLRDRLA